MRIFNLVGRLRRPWKRLIIFIVVCSLTVSIASAGGVTAYNTQGALGRSLGVAPGFSVNSSLLAPQGSLCRSGQTLLDFVGVTIHETSNWSSGATAAMHAQYLRGPAQNQEVSWHYSVDRTSAYQSIPENEKAWHAGDTGMGTGNAHTIAIEICDNAGGDFDQAMANAEWLAADILYRHGVYSVSNHLFQHNQFSAYQKNCPITIRDTGRWPEFSAKTQMYLDQMVAALGTVQISDSNGEIQISGNPANASAMARVDIYADDFRGVGSSSIANGRFLFLVDSAFFKTGWHTLIFALIQNDGSIRWSTYDYLVGPEAQLFIESPANGGQVYGNVSVSGWAVSHSGISKMNFYLDDLGFIGSTSNILQRSDVNETVNGAGLYRNALFSGYSYSIDYRQLSEGQHVVGVEAVSYDGSSVYMNRIFYVGKNGCVFIESPQNGMYFNDITVSGWTIGVEGIAKVEYYLDNKALPGLTTQLLERPDVNNYVKSGNLYKDTLHSGYSYTFDASYFTSGKHTIKVVAVSKDGAEYSAYTEFSVGPESVAFLESPSGLDSEQGDIFVSGWALNHSGIVRVDIYADELQFVGSTSKMLERPDVNNVMNSPNLYKSGLMSGFSYIIPDGFLTPGMHVLRIAAIGNDCSVQWINRIITVG